MGGCARARQMGRTCSQFLMGMGESRVMCRSVFKDAKIFQNLFNYNTSSGPTIWHWAEEVQNVPGKVFSFKWNWLPAGGVATACSSHCLVLSVISMQASPTPATQIGKFNRTHICLFWKILSYETNEDLQILNKRWQVEMLLVETSVAGASLLYNPLPSHLLGLQVDSSSSCNAS